MGEIAKAAGVSRSTVSRAMVDHPRIPAGTVARIRAIAERLGYQRDPSYEVLARQRWGKQRSGFRSTIGFLTHPDLNRDGYLAGARACAARLGYAVDPFELTEYPSAQALERVLQARGVRGLILPIFTERFPVPALEWSRYAAVSCSVDAVHLPFHVVRTNVVRKVEMAWERCRSLGYRRIGIALAYSEYNELDRRREATARQCLATVAESERVKIWCGSFAALDGFDAWLRQEKPDALIAGQHQVLFRIDALTQQSGRKLPHCCLIESSGRACLSSRPERIGEVALSVLHQQLMENNLGPPHDPYTVVVEPKWVDGPSLPRA